MSENGQIDANQVIAGLQRRLGEAMTTITVLEIQLENANNPTQTEGEAPSYE